VKDFFIGAAVLLILGLGVYWLPAWALLLLLVLAYS
jgi:hypothetical protein